MSKTKKQFEEVTSKSKNLFMNKMKDYGTAWRILRTKSLTDQIYIKAQRIRSIEEKGVQKIEENITSEYIGILNYSIMALIQLELIGDDNLVLEEKQTESLYDKYIDIAKKLMLDKNHDYGEAWRSMRISSITDIILMKLLRIKQIEDNSGATCVSEGLDANYHDMINYSVFALIRLMKLK